MFSSWSLSKVFNPQPGWYVGDFHVHSHHSDGHYSPAELVEMARRAGLDFLALTDHNSVDAFRQPPPDPAFLIIPGMEVTLQNGHFNIFGLSRRLDWMENICIGLPTVRLAGAYSTTTALLQQMGQQGLLTSLNHPFHQPYHWQDNTTDLATIHALEIWNRAAWPTLWPDNRRAVALWTRLLNAGWRLTALGGSDFHTATPRPGSTRPADRLGYPRAYVYADNLSAAAILEGVRQRRVYLTVGPTVTFQARFGDDVYGLGADLGSITGQIGFTANVADCLPPLRAHLVKNGQVVASHSIEAPQATFHYHETLESTAYSWYRLDLYDAQNRLVLLTNPFFVGQRRPPFVKTYGEANR